MPGGVHTPAGCRTRGGVPARCAWAALACHSPARGPDGQPSQAASLHWLPCPLACVQWPATGSAWDGGTAALGQGAAAMQGGKRGHGVRQNAEAGIVIQGEGPDANGPAEVEHGSDPHI
eukprot:1157656-Pelagomonas_calceolata.AAC.6